MKLAILGRSPLALEAALRFHFHGAAFTWFLDDHDLSFFSSEQVDAFAFTSNLGLNFLKEKGLSYSPQKFTFSNWSENYEKPIMNFLSVEQELKNEKVISITKRYLAPKENIKESSRFKDLFRVIFNVDPRDFIAEQKEVDPESYKRLSEEFVSSLASSIEMYQDFDMVLDFRTDLDRASASVTGRALGEGRNYDRVFYAMEALNATNSIIHNPDIREIAVVGSDALSAEMIIALSDWCKNKNHMLFVVSAEEDPFETFLNKSLPLVRSKLKEVLLFMENDFKQEMEEFSAKLREWHELDDFVKVKKMRPSEPIPRLNFFSGHNVTAIDELIDRKRLFLTIEKPDFRSGLKHPENNHLDLKTIGVDAILVGNSKKEKSFTQLDLPEKGFFELTPTTLTFVNAWEEDLKRLEGIENEIFTLFSPAHSH